MTPQEKAIDLKNQFYYALPNNGSLKNGLNSCEARHAEAVICALVAVNEILNNKGILLVGSRKYWEEVKQEIEKL